MSDLPRGPKADPWPRPLPARSFIAGTHMNLEPLHRRHAADLFEAARGADDSWTYLSYGPFPTPNDFETFVAASAAKQDRITWAVRPVVSGKISGMISLMDIEPENAAIELGGIWFAPRLQRTRAATEAMFLLLRRAADELGYRRLVWKCDTLNAASIRAATRLGFVREGTLRAHKVVKGHQRDTAMFSMTAGEWPACREAILAWLAPDNFAPDGTALRALAECRVK